MSRVRREKVGDAAVHGLSLDGLRIAGQWAALPSDHLDLALKAIELEAAAARAHEYRMRKLQHTHRRCLAGLAAGLTVAIGMLTGSVVLGLHHQAWLASLFAGPSLLALVSVFVLRKVDSAQAKAVNQSFDSMRRTASD